MNLWNKCRQQEFEQSAIGRAARAQAAKEKQSGNQTANRGEPVLKVLFIVI